MAATAYEQHSGFFDHAEESSVLNYEQVCRLDNILSETMDICGVCGLPRISVTIKDFILKIKDEFNSSQFPMIDIRLNGGAAAAVLDPLKSYQFNDIDILIGFDSFQTDDDDLYFNDTIRLVLNVIESMLQPMSDTIEKLFRSQKLSYLQKLIRIQNAINGDSWSLLGLGGGGSEFSNSSRKIDLKFTKRIQRQFEFSIDSFQIVLDSLLTFYEGFYKFSNSNLKFTENFYPTVSAFSKWTNLSDALRHLSKRLIVTTMPETIRGGGLLKYCKLLVQGFSVPPETEVARLELYMCSRFFIDYADLDSQQKVIEGFLKNHFHSNIGQSFLKKLHRVISVSGMCLMKTERHQILHVINRLVIGFNRFDPLCAAKSALSFVSTDRLLSHRSKNTLIVFLHEPIWSLDERVYDDIVAPPLVASSYLNSRSSSANTFWSTPTDMSPIDGGSD